MAFYRTVFVTFWDDPKVTEQMDINTRYLFLFLLTNTHANVCGCYELTIRKMAYEAIMDVGEVKTALANLEELGMIEYSNETSEVFITNWIKYHWNKSERSVKGILNAADSVKSEKFRSSIYAACKGLVSDEEAAYMGLVSAKQGACKGLVSLPTNTITNTNTISFINNKEDNSKSDLVTKAADPHCPKCGNVMFRQNGYWYCARHGIAKAAANG